MVEAFGSLRSFWPRSYADAACLIVDIQLPGITGLELQGKLAGADTCRRIRQRARNESESRKSDETGCSGFSAVSGKTC